MPSVWTRKQKGYSALDQRVVSSEEGIVRAGRLLNATMERNRIVCVFDGDYSAHGSVVYSAVRLLIDQLGDDVSYDVFCQDVYRGPKFKGAARVTEGQRIRALPGPIKHIARRLRHMAISLRISESPERWASNLEQGEEKLLPHLFDADNIQAVIVFTTDPGFALRVARIAHIYASTETPHLIVVTPNGRMDPRAKTDLDWLGVHVLQDGDLVVNRNRAASPDSADDPEIKVTSPMFSFLAPEEYPRQLTNVRDQIEWPAWIGANRPYPRRVRDVVLFVRPDWTNCGSGTTFENLARWFRERDSLLIDVGIWPFGEHFDPIGLKARVDSEQHHIRAALYFAARRSTCALHVVRQIGILFRWFPWSVARQKLLQYSLAAKPRLIRQAVRRAKISHIYLNHYFTYGYAHDFIADRPFFLDTHDIQTVNFIHHNQRNAITRRADRFVASLRDEMEISGMAARLCFVSPDELDLAALHLDRARLDYVLPLPGVTACPPRPPGTPPNLLIISSNNMANEQSLNWFFSQVWPAVLRLSQGQPTPTLRICGNIDAAMAHVNFPDVEFVGVVPELWTYYDECDLVLLPIITGGGVAIKTLEAVMHERPVLATRHALRGLPDDVVRTIGHEDDPVEYAKSLLEIVLDKTRHRARLDRSRQAAALLKEHSFYGTLGRAVDAVRLGEPQVARVPATRQDRSNPSPL
jgi:hypothetical protein